MEWGRQEITFWRGISVNSRFQKCSRACLCRACVNMQIYVHMNMCMYMHAFSNCPWNQETKTFQQQWGHLILHKVLVSNTITNKRNQAPQRNNWVQDWYSICLESHVTSERKEVLKKKNGFCHKDIGESLKGFQLANLGQFEHQNNY